MINVPQGETRNKQTKINQPNPAAPGYSHLQESPSHPASPCGRTAGAGAGQGPRQGDGEDGGLGEEGGHGEEGDMEPRRAQHRPAPRRPPAAPGGAAHPPWSAAGTAALPGARRSPRRRGRPPARRGAGRARPAAALREVRCGEGTAARAVPSGPEPSEQRGWRGSLGLVKASSDR